MGRRGRGEGTIYRRKDGRWEARLDLGWLGGRRRRKAVYGATRREVQDQLAKLRRDQQLGRLGLGPRQTVEQFLTRWLSDVAKPKLRYSTFARYEQLIRRHIVPELGRIQLDRLSPQDVQRLLIAKSEPKLSPRSVFHLRAVLRTALNQALRWNLVYRNAAALAEPPRVPLRESMVLDAGQARRLLQFAREDRLEALYCVAVALGLRQGEALGLRWRDIDLDGSTLTVRHALQNVEGRPTLVETKTRRSRRTLVLPAAVAESLRRHRARQVQERLAAGPEWNELDFVFTSAVGTPLDDSNVRRSFRRLLSRAELPPIRFYDLRHSCASLLLAMGVPARVVMEVLGHSQITLTLDTYSHVVPTLMHQAADAMDKVLSRA